MSKEDHDTSGRGKEKGKLYPSNWQFAQTNWPTRWYAPVAPFKFCRRIV